MNIKTDMHANFTIKLVLLAALLALASGCGSMPSFSLPSIWPFSSDENQNDGEVKVDLQAARPAGIPLVPPPSMMRIDGKDGSLDKKLAAGSSEQMAPIAYFSESKSWKRYTEKESDTPTPDILAYAAVAQNKGDPLSIQDFAGIKNSIIQSSGAQEMHILANQARFITFQSADKGVGKHGRQIDVEIISTMMIIDGRVVTLYMINSAGPDYTNMCRNIALRWRDAYLRASRPLAS